ncbi:MAG: hypothetical protein IPM54_13500 [Polyangiaceae bacterium]|nr:hypothetical protein [Polyangiaceae bacterium]
MALDLTTLSPEARAAFIKDGERFSSEDTLAQANQTLNAYATHGAKLADYGFDPADATELQDARDGLIAAGVGREAKRTSKKIDTAAHSAAMRNGQGTRLRARSVLGGAKRTLLASGNIATVQKIEALLERDSVAADDAEGLAKQLDALKDMLKEQAIADAAKNRGGPKAVTDLGTDAQALRDAAKAKAEPRGTPAETELLDLLDGIIVSLARTAREAAEAAARELSEPAMATAFELSALYKRRAKKKGDEPTGGGGEGG